MIIPKREPSLTIAIPASLTSDTPHLREKTYKIGLIGRAAAIFRVDKIIVFSDFPNQDQSRDSRLIYTILDYLNTPQYLRKAIFPRKRELKYVGILPPLRTPHHPTSKRVDDLKAGDFRDGVVVKHNKSNSLVDIGVEKLAILHKRAHPLKSRITIKIMGINQKRPIISMVKKEEINIYWGYDVTVLNLQLGKIIKRGKYDLAIMTSRYGKPLTHVLGKIKKQWRKAHKVFLAFGSPKEGLREILKKENTGIEEVADFVVNTIPQQGTETVRTEEAIYATLAISNITMK